MIHSPILHHRFVRCIMHPIGRPRGGGCGSILCEPGLDGWTGCCGCGLLPLLTSLLEKQKIYHKCTQLEEVTKSVTCYFSFVLWCPIHTKEIGFFIIISISTKSIQKHIYFNLHIIVHVSVTKLGESLDNSYRHSNLELTNEKGEKLHHTNILLSKWVNQKFEHKQRLLSDLESVAYPYKSPKSSWKYILTPSPLPLVVLETALLDVGVCRLFT